MDVNSRHETEIDRNFDFFQRNLASYLAGNEGKYALLHDCALIGFYPSVCDAERDGVRNFGDAPFSIQEVTRDTVDLGFFSYALANG